MNTTQISSSRRAQSSIATNPPSSSFLTPHFDTQPQPDALRITVWVPGVQSSGIEITTRGGDLTVNATKSQVLRSNWRTLHLESAQRNYQLNLRLGRSWDFNQLAAKLEDGILTIDLPAHRNQNSDTLRGAVRASAA